jgi:hypothetical protein
VADLKRWAKTKVTAALTENLLTILLLLLAALSSCFTIAHYKRRSINVGSFFFRHEIAERTHRRAYWFALIIESLAVIFVGAIACSRLLKLTS